MSSILKLGKSFTQIILTIREVGVTRIPILLKIRRKGETSLEILSFYYIYKLATMCHLVHTTILGTIIHISEIMKLRLKEVILPQITKLAQVSDLEPFPSSQDSFWDTFFTCCIKTHGLCSSPKYGQPAFQGLTHYGYKLIPVSRVHYISTLMLKETSGAGMLPN